MAARRFRSRSFAATRFHFGDRALYKNDDLFRRAGLDPAKPLETWDDLLRAARAITETIPDTKGFGMNAGEREILFKKFMPFAWGNGGNILDATGTKSVMASPENLAALRFYLSLKPYSLLDRQEMHEQAFGKGRLGMVISGPWLLRTLPTTAPDLRVSVSLMPRPAAGKGTHASFAGAEVLGIFRRAKDQEEALKLAEFIVDFWLLDFGTDPAAVFEKHGEMPLPPYLRREAEEFDRDRYQTVYARVPGAVGAPTAGLHFDDALLEACSAPVSRRLKSPCTSVRARSSRCEWMLSRNTGCCRSNTILRRGPPTSSIAQKQKAGG